ncbi:MAG: hypothetical protein IPJ81_07355 [Chitinophagaceae bacterium]|nr:hypothetical protein [Chitinophagaceae bacterium]
MKKLLVIALLFFNTFLFAQDIPDPAKFEQKIWQCIKQKDTGCLFNNFMAVDDLTIIYESQKSNPDEIYREKLKDNIKEWKEDYEEGHQQMQMKSYALLVRLQRLIPDFSKIKYVNGGYKILNSEGIKELLPSIALVNEIRFSTGDEKIYKISFSSFKVADNWRLIEIDDFITVINSKGVEVGEIRDIYREFEN